MSSATTVFFISKVQVQSFNESMTQVKSSMEKLPGMHYFMLQQINESKENPESVGFLMTVIFETEEQYVDFKSKHHDEVMGPLNPSHFIGKMSHYEGQVKLVTCENH